MSVGPGAPLFDAIKTGNLSIVEDSCSNMTTFNVLKSTSNLDTPFFYTISVLPRPGDWLDKFQLLVAKGAKFTSRNVKWETILVYAVSHLNETEYEQLANYLIKSDHQALFLVPSGKGDTLLQEYV